MVPAINSITQEELCIYFAVEIGINIQYLRNYGKIEI